ncbi:MAG: hypothetical protein QM676_07900 [Novosphingobium sp.]
MKLMAPFAAVIIGILTVGLVVAISSRRAAFDRGVEVCTGAIDKQSAAEDARMDLQRGERRFFFDYGGEFDDKGMATGLVLQWSSKGIPLKGCRSKLPPAEWRTRAFQSFADYRLIRLGDPFTGRVDPFYSPRTVCGKAYEKYIRAYNAEMAKLSPGSIKEYCS